MTAGLWELALAVGLFVVSHMVLSGTEIRSRLVGRFGQWPFIGVYSVLALALFTWAVQAFAAAPEVVLWRPPAAIRLVFGPVMVVAAMFVVAGCTQPNPTAVFLDRLAAGRGPKGITKITRHPVMWGVGMWAVVHMLAAGKAAALILFGGLAVLSLVGTFNMDRRRRRTGGEEWRRLEAETSNVPFVALIQRRTRLGLREIGWWRLGLGLAFYAALLLGHETVIGVSPFAG